MKNDVLASKGSLQGIYGVYQTTNERTSWKSASKAIWYVPDKKYWGIGGSINFGSLTWEIATDQVHISPSDVPNNKWYYYKNEWEKGDGDIIVQCVNDKGKIALLTLEISANNGLAFLYFLRLH